MKKRAELTARRLKSLVVKLVQMRLKGDTPTSKLVFDFVYPDELNVRNLKNSPKKLRKLVSRANKFLDDRLGKPDGEKQWIISLPNQGYELTKAVQWRIEPESRFKKTTDGGAYA